MSFSVHDGTVKLPFLDRYTAIDSDGDPILGCVGLVGPEAEDNCVTVRDVGQQTSNF